MAYPKFSIQFYPFTIMFMESNEIDVFVHENELIWSDLIPGHGIAMSLGVLLIIWMRAICYGKMSSFGVIMWIKGSENAQIVHENELIWFDLIPGPASAVSLGVLAWL